MMNPYSMIKTLIQTALARQQMQGPRFMPKTGVRPSPRPIGQRKARKRFRQTGYRY